MGGLITKIIQPFTTFLFVCRIMLHMDTEVGFYRVGEHLKCAYMMRLKARACMSVIFRGSEWGGPLVGCRLSVKIQLLCR